MANYSISDTTLTALGDAVRKHTSETKIGYEPFTYHEFNFDAHNQEDIDKTYIDSIYNKLNVIYEIPGAVGYKLVYDSDMAYTASPMITILVRNNNGAPDNDSTYRISPNSNSGIGMEHIIQPTDPVNYNKLAIEFRIYLQGLYDDPCWINMKIYGLDADGNELTEIPVTVKNTMTPMQMVDKINDFPLVPEEGFNVTGNCSYRFGYDGWNWFINACGEKIKTTNIDGIMDMFYYSSNLEEIPFIINVRSGIAMTAQNVFDSCYKLKTPPKILNLKASNISEMFTDCRRLKEIPSDYTDTWDWSYFDTSTSSYSGDTGNVFENCYSMRRFPIEWLEHGNPVVNYSYAWYYYMASHGYAFDEITNIPFPHYKATWTSNAFSSTFTQCGRAKNITFKLQDDGTPYVMNGWKSQTIDLTQYVGYEVTDTCITSWNSGLTADTRITDAASYEALKDNPDSWTTDINYSRYNHDSAVNTINSLPDVSGSGGTNTIKFKKAAGALTDGGAISSLTQEEIAVAAAKGWTVTLS